MSTGETTMLRDRLPGPAPHEHHVTSWLRTPHAGPAPPHRTRPPVVAGAICTLTLAAVASPVLFRSDA